MNHLLLVIFVFFVLILLPSAHAEPNIKHTLFDVVLSPKDFDAEGPNHQILILKPDESTSIPIKITNQDSTQHEISLDIPFPENISNLVENYSFEPKTIQVPANSETLVNLHIQAKNDTDSYWGKFDFFAKSKSFGIVGKSFYIVIGDKKTEIDPFVDHSMRVDLPGPAFSQLTNDFPQESSKLIENLDKIMPTGFVAPRYLPNGYSFQGQSTPNPNLGLVYAPLKVTNTTESVDFWQSGGLLIYSEMNSPNFNLTSWMPAYSAQNDAKQIMVNGAVGVATEQQERVVAYEQVKYKFPAELVLFYDDAMLDLRGNVPLDELIKVAASMRPINDKAEMPDSALEAPMLLRSDIKKIPLPLDIRKSIWDYCFSLDEQTKEERLFWETLHIRLLSMTPEFQSLKGERTSVTIKEGVSTDMCPLGVIMEGTFLSENDNEHRFKLVYDGNTFRYQIDDVFPSQYEGVLESPLKQYKVGIPTSVIQCEEGMILATKNSNGHPICVRPETLEKLGQRHWADQPHPYSPYPDHN